MTLDPAEPSWLDLNRPRSVAEIFLAALGLYGRYPLLFLLLALAVVAPVELILLAATGSGPYATRSPGLGWGLLLLDTALVTPLISGLHVHAVFTIGQGGEPKLLDVARRGVAVLPVVAAASIMSGLGVAIGFVFLIIPGIILALRWAVVAQAAAIEDDGGGWLAALRRSRELAQKNYVHIFGLVLLALVIATALGVAGRESVGRGAGALDVLGGIAILTLARSFAALIHAVLYYDLRARHQLARTPND